MIASGWEWAKYRAKRQDELREYQTRTRAHAEVQIEWQLPPELLPVRKRRIRFLSDKYSYLWYVNGNSKPQSFVYVLKDPNTKAIRYVGLTDDPPRRHMEHRKSKKLGASFLMVVVAVGDEQTEKYWISKCVAEGCDLINILTPMREK